MEETEFERAVNDYIKANGMLPEGSRVIAALSGGADSVCLLRVLAKSPERQGRVRALHVHHGLRGEEADRDAYFVRRLCADWGIPLRVVYRDVRRYAKEQGVSEEEAGRILRYKALEEAAWDWEQEQPSCRVKIAVAHHQDDLAETIFHHLLRGSGMRGLAGMKPVQGRRIRPLLCVRRSDIREYLRGVGVPWCEDSTNQETGCTRNRIRNEIFPLLAREVNAHAVENILHAGELFARTDRYLEGQAARVLEESGRTQADRAKIRLTDFLAQDPVIRSYVLRLMLDAAGQGQKDITARHFAQLERLAALPVGSRMDLPGKLSARRDYEYLWIEAGRGTALCAEPGKSPMEQGEILQLCTFSRQKGMEIPKNQYTKWFDYDRIRGTLSVRTRQSGDYLTLAGGGRKPLNRYMIDEKIPRQERDKILLLAEGHHILWVIGYRISEYYKITEETQTILQAVKNGGERDGRQNSGIVVGRGSGPQDQ